MDRQLIEYYPDYLREFREIKLLAESQQEQAEVLWENAERLWDNQFAESLDEEGCSRWETLLKIHNRDTYTLQERRDKIASRIVEQRPFTVRMLRRNLEALCGTDGYILEVDQLNYKVSVKVSLKSRNALEGVEKLLDRIIPLNMELYIILLYNTHMFLSQYTHKDLKIYTYDQLRNQYMNRD